MSPADKLAALRAWLVREIAAAEANAAHAVTVTDPRLGWMATPRAPLCSLVADTLRTVLAELDGGAS